MASVDREPDLVAEFRAMRSRIAELERTLANRLTAQSPPWVNLTPQGGFSNAGSPQAPLSCYRDAFGEVHIRGCVQTPALNGIYLVASFPDTSYVPQYLQEMPVTGVHANTQAIILGELGGLGASPPGLYVSAIGYAAGDFIFFDGVTFRTET